MLLTVYRTIEPDPGKRAGNQRVESEMFVAVGRRALRWICFKTECSIAQSHWLAASTGGTAEKEGTHRCTYLACDSACGRRPGGKVAAAMRFAFMRS